MFTYFDSSSFRTFTHYQNVCWFLGEKKKKKKEDYLVEQSWIIIFRNMYIYFIMNTFL